MKKICLLLVFALLIGTLCFTLLSCNDTQPATDETTGGEPSDSTPVEETTPSIEELTDPEKSREVQFTTEYSYRFGEKYFIR